MGVFNNFPYTNWHELNLDWFIAEFERLQSEWDSFGYTVTATAVVGAVPSVNVTGDLESGLNFEFTLVKGETGDEGPEGPAGNGIQSVSIDGSYQLTFTFTDGTTFTTPPLKGPQGEGLEILDTYPTLADLQTAHPYGSPGDAYLIGVSPSFMLYIWSSSSNAWVQAGALSSPSPSTTTPIMNGIASTGSEFAYARGDHIHPVDTSRASQTDLTNLDTRVGVDEGNISTAQADILLLQSGKQNTLVSGTNIKTLNTESLLGSGDISIPVISIKTITDTLGNTGVMLDINYPTGFTQTTTAVIDIQVQQTDGSWRTGDGVGLDTGRLFVQLNQSNIQVYNNYTAFANRPIKLVLLKI